MNKILLLLAFVVLSVSFFAGCPAQGPEPPVPPVQPQMYTCPDGSLVQSAALCPKQCTGSAADHCDSDKLLNGGRCVEGEWRYAEEACEFGCENAACKPAPLNCTSTDACKVGSEVEGACVYENVEDETTCGTNMTCQAGICSTHVVLTGVNCTTIEPCKAGRVLNGECVYGNADEGSVCGEEKVCKAGACVGAAVPPANVTPPVEASAPSEAELKKAMGCYSDFTTKYYRYTENWPYSVRKYNIEMSSGTSGSMHVMTVKHTELSQSWPEYNAIVQTDYLDGSTCACKQRQLSVRYNAYGSHGASDVLQGGKCGTLIADIPTKAIFYDYAKPELLKNMGIEEVNLPSFTGPAARLYEETADSDGNPMNVSYWIVDMYPVPIKVGGTVTYVNTRETVKFSLELLP